MTSLATLRSRLGGPSLELHSAAQRGDVEEVRARLQAGEEVQQGTGKGYTDEWDSKEE